MKATLACLPCLVRQSWETACLATGNPAKREKIMRRVLRLVSELDLRIAPPLMAQKTQQVIREESGCADPFAGAKHRFNRLMMNAYPRLSHQVKHADDGFSTALRLAIAGNIIDVGATPELREHHIWQTMKRADDQIISEKMTETMRRVTADAQRILYLVDNAGEIVLDRLLIEEIGPDKITVAVKSKPILNDATAEDAEDAGLTSLVTVMETGSGAPGTPLAAASRSFLRRFREADLVIAKGQGNFETLNDADRPIFFLLWVKCPVLAAELDCPVDTAVVHYSEPVIYRMPVEGSDYSHVE